MKPIWESLRWRMFLLYVGLAILLSTGIGVWFYLLAQASFIDTRGQQAKAMVHWALDRAPPRGSLSVDDINAVARRLAVSPSPSFSFYLLDRAGGVVRPLGLGDQPNPSDPLALTERAQVIQQMKEAQFVESAPDRDSRTLVYLFPVLDPQGRLLGGIQTEIDLREVDASLMELRWAIGGGVAAFLLAACALWFIVTRVSLRPIEAMARVSRSVGRGEFHRRAPVPRSLSEARDMAVAFNQMLDRIEGELTRDKQRQQQLERLLADVAHEFRSPLAVIKGYTDVLARSGAADPADAQAAHRAIRNSLARLTRLTEKLLTLSMLDSGLGVLLTDVEVNSLCQEASQTMGLLAEGREIAFQAGPPSFVKADPELLRRALLNLLQNAVQHTAPRGKITVSLAREDGRCRITVADDGEGIPAEHLGRIFERLYRVDKARPGGVGLGLAIAKGIAEAHGGTLSVSSEPGKGTAFTVTLPLAPDEVGAGKGPTDGVPGSVDYASEPLPHTGDTSHAEVKVV